jgi:phage terminase small subunit
MSDNLTPLQARFVEEYLIDLNATQAAKRAGSKAKNLTVAGAEFLANPNIQAAIDQAKLERSKETKIDAAWVLTRLAEEATADVGDLYHADGHLKPINEWPKIWRQGLVAGIDVEEIQVEGVKMGEIKKIRLSDRIRRLELIGKHVKVNAFQEVVQHKGLEGLADRLARAKKRSPE